MGLEVAAITMHSVLAAVGGVAGLGLLVRALLKEHDRRVVEKNGRLN